MLLTCTLYYDAWTGYLIRLIQTVCNYRKCSFLTGLITSLTDLLQANHQGWMGTTKTKSTGSPAPALITLLSEFFCFALAKIFFRPRWEPVSRLPKSTPGGNPVQWESCFEISYCFILFHTRIHLQTHDDLSTGLHPRMKIPMFFSNLAYW